MNRGFTVIELVVSIAIFAAMTALVVAKYGNFNQSTLFTDTAYDIALAIHTAQTYGLSVKSASSAFNSAYGLDLSTRSSGSDACGAAGADYKDLVLFADTTADNVCTASDANITTYVITRGAIVSALCAGTQASCTAKARLDVSFLRPNPEATICGDGSCSGNTYALVTLTATDGSTRSIEIRDNGQVSVLPQ